LILHLGSHYAEHRIVNYIVAQVQDCEVGIVIVLYLLANVLDCGLVFAEEVLDELLPVNIQDVLVLLVLF
jgi:3-deoxy-D-arabino-heptulosonate 7-phosphate (DAHP) synthase